jgi:hypothetical protein
MTAFLARPIFSSLLKGLKTAQYTTCYLTFFIDVRQSVVSLSLSLSLSVSPSLFNLNFHAQLLHGIPRGDI